MRECIPCQRVPTHTERVQEEIAGDGRQAVIPAGRIDLPFAVPRGRRRFQGWLLCVRVNERDGHGSEESIHHQRRGGGEAGNEQVGGFCGQVLARQRDDTRKLGAHELSGEMDST